MKLSLTVNVIVCIKMHASIKRNWIYSTKAVRGEHIVARQR